MALSGWGAFLVVLLVLAVFAGAGYVVYAHLRARRLGLPPPSFNPFKQQRGGSTYRPPAPAPGGIQGWVNSKLRAWRNRRTAGGAYEGTALGVGGQRREFGPIDGDETWNTRIDHEADAYYEEQELGLTDPDHSLYAGGGYRERGRGQEQLDARYDEEMNRHNPFGAGAEESNIGVRGVSPRPMENKKVPEESPTERRSMFRENV
ncbi:hypothetical protein K470DRAFT_274359 [Piedraia hortae CBS 480.64]|uniref:Acid phosphatase-like protein n=1 Tax=Piedraia hortae CBS 480.64 TaxID=1314780 RepID=A0A6A7C904_9PEZI|nr:hypothetical protein K470DRAFT_274359 [Piedraia hortae CBS 480.64]